jgi:tetratricopeptide (TPR) repeat protein
MKRCSLAVLVLLGGLLLPLVAAADPAEDAKELVQKGAQLYQDGDWDGAKDAYEKAYKTAPDDNPIKAEAALEWTNLLWEQGYYSQAATRVDDALKLAKRLDLDQAVGRLLLTQGHIEASLGKLSSAENTLKICIRMANEQKDDVFGSLCALNHRLVRQIRGRSVGSEDEFRKAVKKLEATGNPLAVGSSLAKTAELYEQNGQHDRALGLLRKAQDKFQEAGSVPAKTRNRLRFARVLQAQGNYADAQAYLDGLVSRFKAMNNRPALVDAYMLTAQDAEYEGNQGQAQQAYSKALSVAKATGSPQMIARVSLAYCEFAGRMGSVGPATKHCTAAADAFEKVGIPGLAARARVQLAGLAQISGNMREASKLYHKVIDELEDSTTPGASNPTVLATQRANLCQVELQLKSTGAYMICRKALEALAKLDSPDQHMVAMTEYAVGITANKDGKPSKGIEHLAKAAEMAPKLETPAWELAADALLHRGSIVARSAKRRDEAIADFRKGLGYAQKGSGPSIEQSERQIRLQLAQVLLKADKSDDAKTQLQTLVNDAKLDAGSKAWAYSALANVYASAGENDKAREALEAGLPLAKESGDEDLVETIETNLKQF